MPNRIIKESICRSTSFNSLSAVEENLFIRLIVVCDDYGRFDGRAEIIKGYCYPLKDIRIAQIEKALDNLSTAGMVFRYEVDGKPYLQLTNWERHQQKRAKNSKYPAPDKTCNQLISDDCKCPRESRNENRESRNENRESRACVIAPVTHFEEFSFAYPKDCNRYLTEHEYVSLLLTGKITEEELIKCAQNYAEWCKTEVSDKRYIKNAENFLKENVFEKYLPENYKKPDPKAGNKFNQFEQQNYDISELEKNILSN